MAFIALPKRPWDYPVHYNLYKFYFIIQSTCRKTLTKFYHYADVFHCMLCQIRSTTLPYVRIGWTERIINKLQCSERSLLNKLNVKHLIRTRFGHICLSKSLKNILSQVFLGYRSRSHWSLTLKWCPFLNSCLIYWPVWTCFFAYTCVLGEGRAK